MKSNMEGLGYYLNAAGKIPLLSHEEEILLGRSVQAMQALLADNPEGPYTKEESRIIRTGRRARERMINGNMRLVVSVAKRFMFRAHCLELADLVQEGTLGLIRGVEKFDPERGYKFSTFGYWWIRQGIARAIAYSDRMIRLPSGAGDVLSKIRRFVAEQVNITGKIPTTEECAAFANIPLETLEIYLSHAAGHRSLDSQAKTQDDDGCAIVDLLPSSSTNTVEEAWNSIELDRLQHLLGTLTDTEQDVIDQMYGLSTGEPKTLQKLGKERGVSREAVRTAKERALRKIRVKSALMPLLP